MCSALLDLGTAEADSPPNTSQEEGFGNLHNVLGFSFGFSGEVRGLWGRSLV